MKRALISTSDPDVCRQIAARGNFTAMELFPGKADGHKFKPGETRTLFGMEQFPEFNGDKVKITAIREDGPKGKAYYIEGRINKSALNWVYEYRLK